MPAIVPFRGVRFNPDKISFISRVIAPPYDVIDPPLEQELLQRDPHNFVRITLGKTPPGGRPDEAYRACAEHLRQWRETGVLVQEPEPAIYVVQQTFPLGAEELIRLGFIAAVRLEELGRGSIFPHERTFGGPRVDRLKLMAACRASLSQILGVYSDPNTEADRLIGRLCTGQPLFSFRDDDGVGHLVWRVTDADAIRDLQALLRERILFIADGHHRYESALRYSRAGPTGGRGNAPEDYLPMLCISVENAGLRALPTHRRARARVKRSPEQVLSALEGSFAIEPVKVMNAEGLQGDYDAARGADACIGLYPGGQRLYLLRPRDAASLRPRFPASADAWWKLPVCLLHHVVLPDALDLHPGTPEEADHIDYRRDAGQIYWGVESGQFDAGFLLPPIDPRTVQRVASEGERLPQKSTYFHPKIPSGLVFYTHEPATLQRP